VRGRPIGAIRDRADQYLLVTIAAFAVTVAGVRWYLDLAGYPTIGGGDIHLAHVLWGGLLLVVAAILPILLVGRRSLMLAALAAGIGAGLFIDEVGKFVTTSNDYFFAPAAPIIYGGLLLLVLLWSLVRRARGDSPVDATQAAVEALRDGVDGLLTEVDRQRVLGKLRRVEERGRKAGPSIGQTLETALCSPAIDAGLTEPGWVARGDARALLERVLPTRVERWLILLGLLWTALQAVVAFVVLLAQNRIVIGGLEFASDVSGPVAVPTEPVWSLLFLGIAGLVGLGSAVAIALALRGRERLAMRAALITTLIALLVGDLVAFYAFQVAALASTVLDLLLVGLIIDYRIRLYTPTRAADETEPESIAP
jgi:hypothetical protein